MAKIYKALTEDNEVEVIEDVIVEIKEPVTKDEIQNITLTEINNRVDSIQQKLIEYQEMIVRVKAAAQSVKLKN